MKATETVARLYLVWLCVYWAGLAAFVLWLFSY